MLAKKEIKTRKITYAVIAFLGVVCITLGLVGTNVDDINYERHLNNLYETKAYFANQAIAMEDIQKGNIQSVFDTHHVAEELLVELAKQNFKNEQAPTLRKGVKQLKENSDQANKSTTGLVKPSEVTKTFGNNAEYNRFVGELSKHYPNEVRRINTLKTELKQHHFDLANLIKDVNVHASGTHDNLDRIIRKLFLRQKYQDKLTPKQDVTIWKYETKSLIADLKYSSEALDPIIKAIEKLQKDCIKAADNLDQVILNIKADLTNKINKLGYKVAELEKEFASLGGCNFWQNLGSKGGCSRKIRNRKREIQDLQNKFRAEIAVAKGLMERMHYFKDLQKLGRTLSDAAGKLLDSAKKLKVSIDRVLASLTENYTDEEIEENFGVDDEDWIADFTEIFLDDCQGLQKYCKEIMADCVSRKKQLDQALIWG